MNQSQFQPPSLPDIVRGPLPTPPGILDWVGMSKIAQLINFVDGNSELKLSSLVDVFVNLEDPQARGIHMSRLYLILSQLQKEPLTPKLLQHLIQDMLRSHEGLSSAALVKLAFQLPLYRPALVSDNTGLRLYPTEIEASYINGEIQLEMQLRVTYSSSCPCSSALARQVIQESFHERFGDQSDLDTAAVYEWLGTSAGVSAVPHSQRSYVDVRVKLDANAGNKFPLVELVDVLEGTIKTSVQTAAKREDEQEFARLNGQNPMFCEDAARYIKAALNAESAYRDFYLCVRHMESLHAHDAVSVVTKGVAGGYPPCI